MLDFINNKEQRRRFAEIFAKHYNEIVTSDKAKITPEEIEQVLNDPKKMELHDKAIKISNRLEDRKSAKEKAQSENNLENVHSSLRRIIFNKMNIDGNKEAEVENAKVIKDGSTRLGKDRYSQQLIQELCEAKPSDIFPEDFSFEKIVDKVEKNNTIYYTGYCMVDILGSMEMNPEVKKYYDRGAMMLQGYGTILNGVNSLKNQAFLSIPEKVFMDPENSLLVPAIITDVVNEFSKEFENLTKDDKQELSAIAGQISIFGMFAEEFNFYAKEIKEGRLDKGAINSGYYKVDGKECKGNELEDAIKNPDKHTIEYVKYEDKESQEISDLIDKGFDINYQKNEEGIYEYKATSDKEKTAYQRELMKKNNFNKNFANFEKAEKKTNFIFSRDSKEYKDMDKALTQLKQHIINMQKPEEIVKEGRRKNPKAYPNETELIEEIKNVSKIVDIYKEKKEKDQALGKINKNGKKRLEMATKLSKFLKDSLKLDTIIDSPDGPTIKNEEIQKENANPQRKPLAAEKVEKMEKEVNKESVKKEGLETSKAKEVEKSKDVKSID